jgi:hypothetical protein
MNATTDRAIKRTKTGSKIHLGYKNASVTPCGVTAPGFVASIREGEVPSEKAKRICGSAAVLCEHCFPTA